LNLENPSQFDFRYPFKNSGFEEEEEEEGITYCSPIQGTFL
jgi:hypothetical protein